MKTRPDLAALGFCALVVVGVVVLSALHVAIPEFLPAVGMFVAGGGLGVALNTTPAPAPAAALPAAAAAPVPAPRPAPLAADPTTQTFPRIATHAP